MDIPQDLKLEIEKLVEENEHAKIVEESQKISKIYRENDGTGKKFVTKNSEAVAYAISRMPATYAVVYSVLEHTLKNYEKQIKTVIDIGAGTGAATWAVNELISPEKINCLERETEMIKIGNKLIESVVDNVKWEKFDLLEDKIQEKADLVIASYVINELNKQDRKDAILKMWNATNDILIIIEPGTPEGFSHILDVREILLSCGGNIISPCVHSKECKLSKDDWCSFYVRVARSGIQRLSKNGQLGYEDEKFSYIAFSRSVSNGNSNILRILRHPQIEKKHLKVKLCTKDGIQEKVFSKKDGEIYKRARKSKAGDFLQC